MCVCVCFVIRTPPHAQRHFNCALITHLGRISFVLIFSFFFVMYNRPTTSAHESEHSLDNVDTYAAEAHGHSGDCAQYGQWCPHGLLELITEWF